MFSRLKLAIARHGDRRFDQQVVVIGHQAVGMADPVEALAGPRKDIDKGRVIPINVAEKDPATLVVTCRDVMKRTGELTHPVRHRIRNPIPDKNLPVRSPRASPIITLSPYNS
jgi:hypothetical protein